MPGGEILPSPEYYLKIPEIKGDAVHKDHQGEIPVISFSFGGSRATPTGASAGQDREGHVVVQDMTFSAPWSSASPVLMTYMSSGKRIKTATLVSVQAAGKSSKVVLTIELTDVFVTSCQYIAKEGSTLVETDFTLNFAKVDLRFSGDKPDGSPGKNTTGSWDLRVNKP